MPSYLFATYVIAWIGCVKTYSLTMAIAAVACGLLPFFKIAGSVAIIILGLYSLHVLVHAIVNIIGLLLFFRLRSHHYSFGNVG